MILDVGGKRHRTRTSQLPQVYVEYLAVAPENRQNIREPRKVVGCGSSFLGVARTESVRLGWKGRLGLHSLPSASTLRFYRGQGFRDFGADSLEEGCRYMEFSGILSE